MKASVIVMEPRFGEGLLEADKTDIPSLWITKTKSAECENFVPTLGVRQGLNFGVTEADLHVSLRNNRYNLS